MSDRQDEKEHRQRVHGIAPFIPTVRPIPVIGRITQVIVRVSVPADKVRWNPGMTVLPSGWMIKIHPLYMVYVYRQNGQAGMIVNRADPFQYEHMTLTESEMAMVMVWALKMVANDIGRFTPTDGGWMWWRK